MNKPASMSHKEWFIKQISIEHVISEKIVSAVINNQFDTAHDAVANNNSIEFSGFGKFVFNVKRAEKRMLKYESQKAAFSLQLEDETLTPSMRVKTEKKLETALDNIKALAPKLK
jgi:nucleoid DNA-binding protein